ncbi:hypothetical protein DPMN_108793 [Dreissena polymorpha]|uniref:Uncharacterized protein n=1 Tax=Dreissena polymorpha TaxID=45954 RepID=A0A9D4K9F0_DREPO|nr:hypothetical protein DPMN_108793 [Dreissena polymorpha]
MQETPRQCATVPRPSGHMQETPRQYVTLPDSLLDRTGTCRRLSDSLQWCQDRKNTCRRFPDCLQWCQTVSQTCWPHARDSHTFCDVPRPSGQLQETHRQSVTVPDSLSLSRRLFGNLLQVPRRSWHRRRLPGSVLQLPAGLRDCYAPSQTYGSLLQVTRRSYRHSGTFWESPAGASPVLKTLWHRRRLSRCLMQVPIWS